MSYLSTGEFAKLCRVKKDTILFYDREGLLKPKYISDNGYRRYGVEQFYDFDMITVLKETGSSLKEIKRHMQQKNPSEFLAVLEEKQILLRKELERLKQRQTMLESVIQGTKEALNAAYDTLEFHFQAEEHLELFHVEANKTRTKLEDVKRIADYTLYFEEQNRIPTYPFGAILSDNTFVHDFFNPAYFFCKADQSTPEKLLHVKPEGEYAIWAHQGTEQSHSQSLKNMLDKINNTGKKIIGHIYCFEMMTYTLIGSTEEYAAKYCVCLE